PHGAARGPATAPGRAAGRRGDGAGLERRGAVVVPTRGTGGPSRHAPGRVPPGARPACAAYPGPCEGSDVRGRRTAPVVASGVLGRGRYGHGHAGGVLEGRAAERVPAPVPLRSRRAPGLDGGVRR